MNEIFKKIILFIHTHKTKFILALWIIFLVGCGFIISNSNRIITGYTTYQKMEASNYSLEQFGAEITQLKGQLIGLGHEKDKLSEQVAIKNTELNKANAEVVTFNKSMVATKLLTEQQLASMKKEYESLVVKYKTDYEAKAAQLKTDYEVRFGDLNEMLDDYKGSLDSLEESYNNLVINTAKSICCKQKVDNPDIDSYSIKGDKITCNVDKGTNLKCAFE